MCVAFLAPTKRPTEDMISAGWASNPAGAGIAWREDGFVRWEKGLDLEECQRLVKEVPCPMVVHFRIPTVGGKLAELTHPFPIVRNVSNALSGKTKGYVLFHNGHWNPWKERVQAALPGTNWKIPPGKWSDTRAMAWMAAHYGVNILEFIDEKAVAFGPTEVEIFRGQDWSLVNEVFVSNRHWEYTRGYGAHGQGWKQTGGRSDDTKVGGNDYHTTVPHSMVPRDGRRFEHGPVGNVGVESKSDDDQEGGADTTTNPPKGSYKVDDLKVDVGGTHKVLPFPLAQRMFEAGKLSRKKLKKAKKAWTKEKDQEWNAVSKRALTFHLDIPGAKPMILH